MKLKWILIVVFIVLVVFLIVVNWPHKKTINPAWQMDVDASIKAGFTPKIAEENASKIYPKYVAE